MQKFYCLILLCLGLTIASAAESVHFSEFLSSLESRLEKIASEIPDEQPDSPQSLHTADPVRFDSMEKTKQLKTKTSLKSPSERMRSSEIGNPPVMMQSGDSSDKMGRKNSLNKTGRKHPLDRMRSNDSPSKMGKSDNSLQESDLIDFDKTQETRSLHSKTKTVLKSPSDMMRSKSPSDRMRSKSPSDRMRLNDSQSEMEVKSSSNKIE